MTTLSPQEILRKHGIAYIATKKDKYTTKCPSCGKGYCDVKIDREGVQFYCRDCQRGGGEYFEQRDEPKGQRQRDEPKAVYDYTDENGKRLYQSLRFEPIGKPKYFRQRIGPEQKKWTIKGARLAPFHLPQLRDAIANNEVIWIVEGEKDVLTLERYGIAATCNAMGAGKWKEEYNEHFAGADVVICGDNDEPGRRHVRQVAAALFPIARCLRILDLKTIWPAIEESDDVTDWFECAPDAGADLLREVVGNVIPLTEVPPWDDEPQGNGHDDDQPGAKLNGGGKTKRSEQTQYEPWSLGDVLKVFKRWLLLEDQTPILAVLGAVAGNYLDGAPVWLGIIGPPSSAKTEILNSTLLLPQIFQIATFTPAALLSGTPIKQRDKGSRGGLLREVGEFGICVLKDFGSVLSLRMDAKAEALAALRELYDGEWTRRIGTGGGRELHWKGKLGLVFAATGVIDSHHSVIGAMGDRFLLTRLLPERHGQFKRALQHIGGAGKQMRIELAEAVAHLFAGRRAAPQRLNDDEIERLDRSLMLAVRLRGSIERDRRTREIEAIYGAEGTARIGLMVERLIAGLDVLGVERALALEVAESVIMDSVPSIRRDAYEYACQRRDMYGKLEEFKTNELANRLGLPRQTANYALEDLAAYGLVYRRSTESEKGKVTNYWRAIEVADE
jgi:hypothetical protein